MSAVTTADYLAFAASGAACTSLVRTALVPLDVAKACGCGDLYEALGDAQADGPAAPACLLCDATKPAGARCQDDAMAATFVGMAVQGWGSGAPWPEKGQCAAGRQYVPSYSEAHRRVDCVLMVTPGAAEPVAPSPGR